MKESSNQVANVGRWMVVRVDELKPTAKTLYSGVSKQAAKWYAKGYNRRAEQSGVDCKAVICRCH